MVLIFLLFSIFSAEQVRITSISPLKIFLQQNSYLNETDENFLPVFQENTGEFLEDQNIKINFNTEGTLRYYFVIDPPTFVSQVKIKLQQNFCRNIHKIEVAFAPNFNGNYESHAFEINCQQHSENLMINSKTFAKFVRVKFFENSRSTTKATVTKLMFFSEVEQRQIFPFYQIENPELTTQNGSENFKKVILTTQQNLTSVKFKFSPFSTLSNVKILLNQTLSNQNKIFTARAYQSLNGQYLIAEFPGGISATEIDIFSAEVIEQILFFEKVPLIETTQTYDVINTETIDLGEIKKIGRIDVLNNNGEILDLISTKYVFSVTTKQENHSQKQTAIFIVEKGLLEAPISAQFLNVFTSDYIYPIKIRIAFEPNGVCRPVLPSGQEDLIIEKSAYVEGENVVLRCADSSKSLPTALQSNFQCTQIGNAYLVMDDTLINLKDQIESSDGNICV